MSSAIVLGAGGALGWVFHAGVMRALHRDLGLDATNADLIVGTSAGAAVAASLRGGVAPEAIIESVTRGPTAEEQAAMLTELRAARKTLRPLAPGLVGDAVRGQAPVAVALGGLLPPGWFPTSFIERFPGLADIDGWPHGLWIPAVRADEGSLVVFGRDRSDVAVHDAVEASSAIPGMFRPKDIDGVAHFDGGLVSPTHANLPLAAAPELVLVSSPMTRRSRRPMARLARRRLAAERAELEAEGVRTIIVEPPDQLSAVAKGFPRRNPGAAPLIVELAEEATRRALSGSRLARSG